MDQVCCSCSDRLFVLLSHEPSSDLSTVEIPNLPYAMGHVAAGGGVRAGVSRIWALVPTSIGKEAYIYIVYKKSKRYKIQNLEKKTVQFVESKECSCDKGDK